MKKLIALALTFLGIITMTSCSNKETYSLKEAGGFEISNIAQIQASSSVYQSAAWPVSEEVYQYLDCKYIKVDFDINNEFLSSWPPSELQDDAYVLHADIEGVDIYADFGPTFYISHSTRYMYFLGLDSTYRSQNKMSLAFIDLVNNPYSSEKSSSSLPPEPTGQFKLTIIDEHGYIYDKPEQQYFTPFTEIKLHSYPIMDADLSMYVDGEFYSKQTCIETDEGYIWEYTFTMPIGEATLEFSTDPFFPHTYYSFADIFNWVSLLNESTLKAIEIEDGYIGVDPNNPNNAPIIRYSEKIEDINYNLQVLGNEPLVKMHNYEPVDGGSYRKVKYITFEGEEYILEISNGIVFWNDFSSYKHFRFDRTPTNYPDIITESK